ncbi:MAG: hypothetical protein JWM51_121 [Microbacteriaceae bacterium]|jgi:hypothetical protein|nr:hypothetical protein [Microbacteriaceae bacterium]
MTIDWPAFFVVVVATLVSASAVVTLYSLGLRLSDRATGWRRSAGIGCFVACAAVIVYGVYLIIPAFH